MSKNTVGASEGHTRAKHCFLNAFLGKMIGVVAWGRQTSAREPNRAPVTGRALIVDMTAGSGDASEHSSHSSPSIILKHAGFDGLMRTNASCSVLFIEAAENTHQRLLDNFPQIGTTPCINSRCADSRTYLPTWDTFENDPIFIHVDPNSVGSLPLTEPFLSTLPQYALMLVTLGCNAGGVKRMPKEKRMEWVKMIWVIIENLNKFHTRHDLLLISVLRDSSQWAYLLKVPVKWSQEYMELGFKTGAENFDHGVSVFSFREHRNQFMGELKRLSLTTNELENLQ